MAAVASAKGGPGSPWTVTDDIDRLEDTEDAESVQGPNETNPLLAGTSVNTLNTFNAVAVRCAAAPLRPPPPERRRQAVQLTPCDPHSTTPHARPATSPPPLRVPTPPGPPWHAPRFASPHHAKWLDVNGKKPSQDASASTDGLNTKVRAATLSSSIINLTNTIIGAGMLGLPYAVATCGLLFGLLMLVLRCALGRRRGPQQRSAWR